MSEQGGPPRSRYTVPKATGRGERAAPEPYMPSGSRGAADPHASGAASAGSPMGFTPGKPDPSRPSVQLKKGKARPVWAGHPWVYSGALEPFPAQVTPGTLVSVLDDQGRYVGVGAANPTARIAVRMLGFEFGPLEAELRRRIRAARELRARFGLPGPTTTAFRLVNGEGDHLPGVIVDVFGQLVSVQLTTAAAESWLETLLNVLESELQPLGITVSVPEDSARLENIAPGDRFGRGELEAHVPFLENGIEWRLLPGKGQKTGFYSDQRDNRTRLAALCADASVLDCFCYTGGFGLNALKAGAREVVGVDSSGPAVSVAHGTAEQNGLTGGTWHKEDVMRYLKADERQWDVLVLDPPKFARTRDALDDAFRKYLSLNALGLTRVKPGGLLMTCTCSGLVDDTMFLRMLTDAALSAGRRVTVLGVHGTGPDHPIPVACPESRYLTAVLARVD